MSSHRLRLSGLTALIIGLYTAYGYLSGREMPFERVGYAALACAVTGLAVLGLFFGTDRGLLARALIWMASVALLLLPALQQDEIAPLWVAGDACGLLLPAMLLLIGASDPSLFHWNAVQWFGSFHLLGAVVAPLAFSVVGLGDRYEPPHYLLFGVAWVWCWQARSARGRLAWVGLIVALMFLALFSSQRTNVVLGIMTGLVVAWLLGARLSRLMWLTGLLSVLALMLGFFLLQVEESAAYRRFRKLEGGADESLLNRVNEVRDVLRHIRQEWGPLQVLVGEGHGASFSPRLAETSEQNFSDTGRLHNIHFGPAMILFRYGLAGCVVLAAVALGTIRWGVQLRYHHLFQREPCPAEVAICGGMLISLAYMLLFTVLPNPSFSWIWAGTSFYAYRHRLAARAVRQSWPGGSSPIAAPATFTRQPRFPVPL